MNIEQIDRIEALAKQVEPMLARPPAMAWSQGLWDTFRDEIGPREILELCALARQGAADLPR